MVVGGSPADSRKGCPYGLIQIFSRRQRVSDICRPAAKKAGDPLGLPAFLYDFYIYYYIYSV